MVKLFGCGNVSHTLKYYISNIDGASILLKLVIIYSQMTEKYHMQNLGIFFFLSNLIIFGSVGPVQRLINLVSPYGWLNKNLRLIYNKIKKVICYIVNAFGLTTKCLSNV